MKFGVMGARWKMDSKLHVSEIRELLLSELLKINKSCTVGLYLH